jgi:hypothetical protein
VQAVLCGCTISSCSNGVYYSWPADELEEEREAQKKQKAEFKKALEEVGTPQVVHLVTATVEAGHQMCAKSDMSSYNVCKHTTSGSEVITLSCFKQPKFGYQTDWLSGCIGWGKVVAVGMVAIKAGASLIQEQATQSMHPCPGCPCARVLEAYMTLWCERGRLAGVLHLIHDLRTQHWHPGRQRMHCQLHATES